MRDTLIQAFNHVELIGPHVIEGHFDLRKYNQFLPLYCCYSPQSSLQSHETRVPQCAKVD